MICTMEKDSPLGRLLLAGEGAYLVGLWLEGQKYYGSHYTNMKPGTLPVLREAAGWLERYFNGERPDPGELPLRPEGTAFQRLIWELLLEIPYGRTTTYGALAAEAATRLGRDAMSAQAAGGAVGQNPISIMIPCHRVLSATGALTGYAGGVHRKQWLLTHESASAAVDD